MALIESHMISLGTQAPDFTLPDTISGKDLSLGDVVGETATVVMFLCNHCPYVQHLNAGIVALRGDYADKGVGFVAISANDATDYPQDGPDMMTQHAADVGYAFPYLYDASQDVARAYGASCTPDLFIFDGQKNLAYHGRFDTSRPENGEPVTGADFRLALDALIAGDAISSTQYPSVGCSIKWKKS